MDRRLIRPRPDLTYASLCDDFNWSIPEHFNIGTACADDLPAPDPAIITERPDGTVETVTFGDLAALTNRVANLLEGLGIERGDRVAIVLPQGVETVSTHLGIHKMGGVALPLAGVFGPEALRFRLADADARAVVTAPDTLDKVAEAAEGEVMILVTGDDRVARPWHSLEDRMAAASSSRVTATTLSEDPATLIYTSGTTGPPKGALHAHRFLFGHLPAFELFYEFFPQVGDVIWTPADWAWIGALMDVVVPSLYHGRPVLTAERHRFDPDFAADLMARHRVTSAFLPPTALRMMRAAGIHRDDLVLRSIFSGGEALGEETLRWAEASLGTRLNEGYGQTEANLVVGNCGSIWPVRPGSMGRPVPGHDVAVLDGGGAPVVGEEGEVAVRMPDPVAMLRYWNQPRATEEKYEGPWLLTGDLAVRDDDGYLWFRSRKDDVIASMGYRIGPGEIEESLLGHPAVGLAAAVGVPDDLRGQVVKAFVVLNEGYTAGDDLVRTLQNHVRTRLAAHEMPRAIEFRDELPTTTTGKIMRRALRDGT